MKHIERHRSHRNSWLRAAVLGANDGIISTSSLMIGVATANAPHEAILLTGVAGLIAGAMSMAAGEYVSVSSQADTESADLAKEKVELEANHGHEVQELASIYTHRGLEPQLAHQVAIQLMAHDALDAHARDELGITEITSAKPTQAALASAAAFTTGALLPLLIFVLSPMKNTVIVVVLTSLLSLAILGGLAARAGGTKMVTGIVRVTVWGMLAMAATATIGHLFGVMTV